MLLERRRIGAIAGPFLFLVAVGWLGALAGTPRAVHARQVETCVFEYCQQGNCVPDAPDATDCDSSRPQCREPEC